MFVTADRVRDTSTTTGTGPYALVGSVITSYRPFSAVCATNDKFPVFIQHRTLDEWVVGIGTYSAANEVTISTVLVGSNGTSAVSFSAGVKDVVLGSPSELSLITGSEDTIASAATTDIGATGSLAVAISGTVTITSLGTKAYSAKLVRFTGALTLTHNATSLILPGGANITTVAGDTALFVSDASGNWRCYSYDRAFLPGAALTKTDDTNVTLTLGGSPTTALLVAASLTLGWTGQLSLARGGTGANLSDPNADRIMFWDDSAGAVTWLAPGTNLTITGTTIDAAASGLSAGVQSDQETATSNAVAVTPGIQHFHPSAAKFWCRWGVTTTIDASYNMTSITDSGTGDWVLNIGTDFSSANWAAGSMAQNANPQVNFASTQAAGSVEIRSHDYTNLNDPTKNSAWGFGDQA